MTVLYRCTWRPQDDALPFTLTKTGKMTLEKGSPRTLAYRGYSALCGEGDAKLEQTINTSRHPSRADCFALIRERNAARALFYHCFPEIALLPFDNLYVSEHWYFHSDGITNVEAGGGFYSLYLCEGWWENVYQAGEALTDDGGLVIGIEHSHGATNRHVLRWYTDLYHRSLRVHRYEHRMSDGRWV